MGDNVTADTLMRVFAKTAEPVWSMIASWLRNGMPVRDPAGFRSSYEDGSLNDEFFIEDNGLLLVDPDFWKDGYTLRGSSDEDASKTVPVFLAHVVDHVLGSGKAVGLLRALGIQPLSDDGQVWVSDWCSFTALLARETSREPQNHTTTPNVSLFSVSTDALSQIVYEELLRHCQTIAARLTSVLVDECFLWKHLYAIEDLFLMRRGDTMSHFADTIFGKVGIVPLPHSGFSQT
jgi:gamma-tubulin complex component 5